MARAALGALALLLCVSTLVLPAAAFYLPGVAPHDYNPGEDMRVKVEALTSVKTQLPYEYYVLPFCHEGVDLQATQALNLGEVLRGSRIYDTPYDFKMQHDQKCKILCRAVYDREEVQAFALMAEEEYRVNMILDNLPVAVPLYPENAETGETTKAYELGYPIGFVDDGTIPEDEEHKNDHKKKKEGKKIYLFNHLKFTILINTDQSKRTGSRVVGFEVEPISIAHTHVNQINWDKCVDRPAGLGGQCTLNTCSQGKEVTQQVPAMLLQPDRKESTEVIWTYDVKFKHSDIRWSTRWDTYLHSPDDAEVHWFSILNSFMIVLFLSGVVAMIMVRTVRRDFERYQEKDFLEEGQEETGWKLVHGDVFRAPKMAGWLAVLIGTGVQLCISACFLMFFACLGFLSPANRGALMQAMLFIFVFMGLFGGYTSARFFRMFKGNRWRSNALWTACLFPGVSFTIFFVLNMMIWGQKSSGAVPFGTLVALLLMWCGISAPLTLIGAFFGYRKQPIEFPTRINQIPRQVPAQPWFVNGYLNVLVCGVLPFGAVFVEVFYVLSSIWLHQFYYLFGFLFLVLLILLLTCAEITIVMCYFQLCCEDYHWWWRTYFSSGCCSLYLFTYSLYYGLSKLAMARGVAIALYIGYMLIVSYSFFLITGSVGFLATFWFVRTLYGGIKID